MSPSRKRQELAEYVTMRRSSMFTVGFYIWKGLNWSAAALALLTLGERLYGRQVPVWLLLLLSVSAIIYSVGNGFGDKYNIHRFARLSARVSMRKFLRKLEQTYQATLRCNIMLLQGDTLKQAIRIGDPVGRSVTWKLGQGACGESLRRKEPIFLDLQAYQGKPYEALRQRDDGQPMWGITPEQWQHTRDLGGVVSIPVAHPEESSRIIGVLNIDSRTPLSVWLPDAERELLLRNAEPVADFLGVLASQGIWKEAIGNAPD